MITCRQCESSSTQLYKYNDITNYINVFALTLLLNGVTGSMWSNWMRTCSDLGFIHQTPSNLCSLWWRTRWATCRQCWVWMRWRTMSKCSALRPAAREEPDCRVSVTRFSLRWASCSGSVWNSVVKSHDTPAAVQMQKFN